MTPAVEYVRALVEQIREELAPDPRVSVFEVDVELQGDVLVLIGAVSDGAAAEALHQRAAALNAWQEVRDEISRLPEAELDESMHAVVTAAIAPMLAGPRIAQTQVSQAVLGHHLLVLRREGRWLQCRSGDGYIGWIHAGYVALMDESSARAWEIGTEGEVWISLGAELRTEDDEVLVQLPWGARVVRESESIARLPDGSEGRPTGDLIPAALRSLAFPASGEAICASATKWLGVPYLWGGLTQGGVDCSGLLQTLYRMHGRTLPRDADQQSRAGVEVDAGADFELLLPGDLLFFAEEPGRCTHVTMSTGGSRIIHSSLGNGGVARNDLAGRRNYERELRRLFMFARRVF